MSLAVNEATAGKPIKSDVPLDRSWWESLQHDRGPGGFPLNANPRVQTNFVVAKAGAGLLFGFTVYSTVAQNVQVFDLSSFGNLASGAVPWLNYPVQALQSVTVGFQEPWRAFKQGILIANSTTDTTYTAGSANCIFDVQYA